MRSSIRLFHATVFVAVALAFWASMAFDAFNIAPTGFFYNFQQDSEGLVFGKISHAKHSGLFASKAGLGRYRGPELDRLQYIIQLKPNGAVLDQASKLEWEPYRSEIGFQGYVASIAYKALFFVRDDLRPRFLQYGTAFLSAVTIAVFLYQLWLLSGLMVAAPVGLSIFFAPWFIVFGDNLYYALYLWFIPPIVIAAWLLKKRSPATGLVMFSLLVTAAFTLKFVAATGFTWVTVVGTLATVPLFLGYAAGRIDGQGLLTLGAVLCASFLAALAITTALHWAIFGDPMILAERFLVRSGQSYNLPAFQDPYWRAPYVGAWDVLKTYFRGETHFGFGAFWQPLSIGFIGWLILVLLQISGLVPQKWIGSARGVNLAYPASLIGPISWHLIMKQHSFIHTHINYGFWYFPSIGLGFAAAALSVAALPEVWKSIARNRAQATVAASILCAIAGLVVYVFFDERATVRKNAWAAELWAAARPIPSVPQNISVRIHDAKALFLVSGHCSDQVVTIPFFLHVYLPTPPGIQNRDFKFGDKSIVVSGDTCLAIQPLERTDYSRLEYGQFDKKEVRWRGSYVAQ